VGTLGEELLEPRLGQWRSVRPRHANRVEAARAAELAKFVLQCRGERRRAPSPLNGGCEEIAWRIRR
jgi:hypothetical protein